VAPQDDARSKVDSSLPTFSRTTGDEQPESFATAISETLTAARRRALAHVYSVPQHDEASPSDTADAPDLSTASPSLSHPVPEA